MLAGDRSGGQAARRGHIERGKSDGSVIQRIPDREGKGLRIADVVEGLLQRAVVAYGKILAGGDAEAVVQSQRRAGVDGEAYVRGVDGARGLRERFVGPGEIECKSAGARAQKRASCLII